MALGVLWKKRKRETRKRECELTGPATSSVPDDGGRELVAANWCSRVSGKGGRCEGRRRTVCQILCACRGNIGSAMDRLSCHSFGIGRAFPLSRAMSHSRHAAV